MRNAKCIFPIKQKCKSKHQPASGARAGVLGHLSLCPAFRVRRGSSSTDGFMTRYVGSRASGYPPDFGPFRRCGHRRLRPLHARMWASRVAVLPCGSLGRALGKSRSRAGVPRGLTGPVRWYQSTTDSNADARDPTTSPIGAQSCSSGLIQNSRAIVGDRAQRVYGLDKTAFLFGVFPVLDFGIS